MADHTSDASGSVPRKGTLRPLRSTALPETHDRLTHDVRARATTPALGRRRGGEPNLAPARQRLNRRKTARPTRHPPASGRQTRTACAQPRPPRPLSDRAARTTPARGAERSAPRPPQVQKLGGLPLVLRLALGGSCGRRPPVPASSPSPPAACQAVASFSLLIVVFPTEAE